MNPLNNPSLSHKVPKISVVYGTSFLLYCVNHGYDPEDIAQGYLGDLAELTAMLDVWPMEDGVERVKAPDGSHRNIPLLKWVPMAERDPKTGNYIWIYQDGREKLASEVDTQLTHSTLWLDRNPHARRHGLYLNYRMTSRWPPRMGDYQVRITLEAMTE